MNPHLFTSSDGALYDTRSPDWSKAPPLRAKFQYHHAHIRNTQEFKATLRAGAFAWPGGYPLYLICSDGGVLCFDCARKEARNILRAIDNKDGSDWRVTCCEINYEDVHLECEHCGEHIPAAYGED